MKVLFYDIETLPGLWLAFSPKQTYLPASGMLHPPFMLSYAAKWQGERKMHSSILTPEEIANQDDSRIVAELVSLLEEADYAVAHNGDGFDLPIVNSRVAVNNLPSMRRTQTIDTLKLAKKSLRQTYNSLNELAEELGVGKKIPTNFQLWKDCYFGDEKALRKMLRYNKMDVSVLEAVFDRLAPHVRGLPRMVDGDGHSHVSERCRRCGSHSVRKDGQYRAATETYQRYRCNDCGNCQRDTKPLAGMRVGGANVAA